MLTFQGLGVQVTEAGPGNIVLINGIEDIGIGVTVTDPNNPAAAADAEGRRADADDELLRQHQPAGRPRGKFVTSRQIWDRPAKKLQHNVALRVKETAEDGVFEGLRPRRTAPDHPAGKHAPRRLRAGRLQAARGVPDMDGRSASRSSW